MPIRRRAVLVAPALAWLPASAGTQSATAGEPPEQRAAFIAQQRTVWKQIVLRANIKPD